MTDHERIFEWLANGQWHCGTEFKYSWDLRKRISELNKEKEIIEGKACDGRCGTQHRSKTLKMRRWIKEEVPNAQFEVKNAVRPSKNIFIPIKGIIKNEKVNFFQTSLL